MLTVRASNFRVLAQLDWSPDGVCLLAGPNGSGKTSILDLLEFLRVLFQHGHEAALNAIGGRHIQRLGRPLEEPVTFELEVGDVIWKLSFPISTGGLRGAYGEELSRDGQVVLRAAMFDEGWYLENTRHERVASDLRCCAKLLWDRDNPDWMRPFVNSLADIRIYRSYSLDQVRRPSDDTGRFFLHSTGRNLWSVLHGWQSSPTRHPARFEWVMSEARKAFPGIIDKIEFDRGDAYLFGPNATDPADGLPPQRAADGVLTGLLHLTAIAGTPNGGLVAFDEMENQLHPHAIRSILAGMRDRAEERDLTVILTTHSPVVMNAFRHHLDHFYVLELANQGQPKSLDQLHDEEWLAQSFLGELYENLEFGAPELS